MLRCTQGYFIAEDPAPILMVNPSLTMAEAYSKDRFTPFIRDTPILNGLIKDPKTRDSGNTTLHKQFPGGHLTFAGANSVSSLASRPIRILCLDEVDKYPFTTVEGDTSKLAIARTRRFWNKKIIETSTPTLTGHSRIWESLEKSDMRFYTVPCPECEVFQRIVFKNLQWKEGNIDNVKCLCDSCGHLITSTEKVSMIRQGEYKAENPKSKVAGFHAAEFYVIGTDWGEIVEDFLESKNVPELLQVVVNTRFAETFYDGGDAPDHLRLYARFNSYRSFISDGSG